MTIRELKALKQKLGITDARIAELSGLTTETVRKAFAAEHQQPEYGVLKAVENALFPPVQTGSGGAGKACEIAMQYSHDRYTIEDYWNLPDDTRMELIDGVFYYLPAPSTVHQAVVGEVYFRFMNHIRTEKGDCLPILSPFAVQLDCDDQTMVEPDLIIVCNQDKLLRTHMMGAPDLALEVLSPGTRRKDLTIKLKKYEKAGVREYWIVDPEEERVLVYRFESGDPLQIYAFADPVPVGIWDGKLTVDFGEIRAQYRFLEP